MTAAAIWIGACRIPQNRSTRLTLRYGRVNLFVMVLAFVMTTLPLSAQSRNRPTAPSKPAPHFPDGTPNLGITAQERGLWLPLDRNDLGRRSTLAPVETIPFQPWAKALYDDRQIHELEPHTRCHPSGLARQFQTPYGVEFCVCPTSNAFLSSM